MNMSKFERKFGRYAIKNLSLMLILCYACGYFISLINPNFLNYLTLDPYKILHGQIWRIVTWVISPPPSSNIFFLLITLYFYYSLGTTLERTWGEYRYNLYIFSGMLFTVLGSFLLMGYSYLFEGATVAFYGAENYFAIVASYFSTYYVNMSIFLAFAATFPDVQVLLMFVIPVKVKWMGIIYAVMLAYEFIVYPYYLRFVMAASMLNFVVFFFTSRKRVHLSPKQMKRRQEFKRETRKATAITKHKCAICGQTEEDNPDLEFRFCSKCNGNYEYCQNHLFTHEHVR
ncbi:MAG: hypothetical protein IJN54_08500 [Lachnospiraceae bacterium]|nr:hypothetical protein [Lachnospiraceae bacterium]